RHQETHSLVELDGAVRLFDVQRNRLVRLASFIKQLLDERRAYASSPMFRQQGNVSKSNFRISPDNNYVPRGTIINQDDAMIDRKGLRAVMTLLGAELKPHHVVEHDAVEAPSRDLFASGAEIELVEECFIFRASVSGGQQ